ncbi:MAG: hypothetical protein KC493_17710 [Bacteriovoracaceae bacterium]|nr:hypothetical protein [Bacteriovoracaceae bacterium]
MKLTSLLLLPVLCTLSVAESAEKTFYIDSFQYEDTVYSRSKKTELGDETEIEISAKYIYQPGTFARLRFETSPEENRENNETSKFEIQLGHKYQNVDFSLDLELQTNKSSNGGTALGLDLDSEYTNIKWNISESFSLTFFPFNFDGEVGEEFNTWDVTRIKTIEGAPTTVSNSPTGSEKIIEKTIPGFVLSVKPSAVKGFGVYAGFGVASYFYPTNPSFDLLTNTSATSWERKEDLGYKFGVNLDRDLAKMKIELVGHDSSDETGSLLEYAGSFYLIGGFSGLVFDTEFTISKAGERPWYTPRGTTWFETTSPFRKIYSDYFGNAGQDWIGKTDFGAGLRVGYEMGDVTPYLLYRYNGKNFVYIEDESAHLLRTADETLSHGGLNRFGAGAYIAYGNWVVNPELEIKNASNPVFGNAADERSNRLLSTYRKTDYQLALFVNYDIDGDNLFKP